MVKCVHCLACTRAWWHLAISASMAQRSCWDCGMPWFTLTRRAHLGSHAGPMCMGAQQARGVERKAMIVEKCAQKTHPKAWPWQTGPAGVFLTLILNQVSLLLCLQAAQILAYSCYLETMFGPGLMQRLAFSHANQPWEVPFETLRRPTHASRLKTSFMVVFG